MPKSTVHTVLKRPGISRLSYPDRIAGGPIHRYEHDKSGDMLDVDVKKLGRVRRRRVAATSASSRGFNNARANASTSKRGICYPHIVIDAHSRVVYVEAHDDETAATATAVLCRGSTAPDQRQDRTFLPHPGEGPRFDAAHA